MIRVVVALVLGDLLRVVGEMVVGMVGGLVVGIVAVMSLERDSIWGCRRAAWLLPLLRRLPHRRPGSATASCLVAAASTDRPSNGEGDGKEGKDFGGLAGEVVCASSRCR